MFIFDFNIILTNPYRFLTHGHLTPLFSDFSAPPSSPPSPSLLSFSAFSTTYPPFPSPALLSFSAFSTTSLL